MRQCVCRVRYGTTIHFTAGRHTQSIAKVLTKLMLVVEGFKTVSHLHNTQLCSNSIQLSDMIRQHNLSYTASYADSQNIYFENS